MVLEEDVQVLARLFLMMLLLWVVVLLLMLLGPVCSHH